MRKHSIKNTRVNMEVQRELSEILGRGLKDPRIHPMTSVVAVEVTPDLKYCKAYIRRELARRINLRNTPELTFILDQSIEYGVNMSHLIDEVTKDLKRDGEDEGEEGFLEGSPED